MQITFEVPEWTLGKHLHFFRDEKGNFIVTAGTELLAVKEVRISHQNGEHVTSYLPLKVKPKSGRCSGCSECCEAGSSKIILDLMFKTLGNYLIEQGEFSNNKPCPFHSNQGCILRGWIPFSCVRSDCSSFSGCSEYFVEVE